MTSNDLSVLMIDGESKLSLFVARCLAQVPHLRLHVLSEDPWAPLRFSRHKSSCRRIPPAETDAQWLDAIVQTVEQTSGDIILPVGKTATRFVSLHRQQLATLGALVPTPDCDTFDTVIDKWSFAQFSARHGLPSPDTILFTDDANFRHKLDELAFPVLLKPTGDKGGGQGIRYFDTLPLLLEFLDANPQLAGQHIVQTFIYGYDIDCSFLAQDGNILAHTIQKCFIPRPKRFAPPAGIRFIKHAQTLSIITQLAAALRWTGVAHVDMLYDEQDSQVKLIEFNPRFWGSLLGSLDMGVNFPHLACLAGLGIDFPPPDYDLAQFVALDGAMRPVAKKLLGRGDVEFAFRETDLKYMLADPLAEMVKVFGQLARSAGLRVGM